MSVTSTEDRREYIRELGGFGLVWVHISVRYGAVRYARGRLVLLSCQVNKPTIPYIVPYIVLYPILYPILYHTVALERTNHTKGTAVPLQEGDEAIYHIRQVLVLWSKH